MRIWKNGKEAPYMYGLEKVSVEQIKHAVDCMSFGGLATAAACFIHLAQSVGIEPENIMGILEADDKVTPVSENGL